MDPPQYVSAGELDTEYSVLVGREYNRESVHIHAIAWNFLLTVLKRKSDKKSILHRCTSPTEAWDALLAWYGSQTTRAKSDPSRRLNSFKIAPGSRRFCLRNAHPARMTLDDHMLYTIFIDALPAQHEVEARNLASRDSIGRDDIIKAVPERHHRLSGSRKGFNAGNAGHAMFVGGGGAHGKGGGRGKGKGGRRGRQGRGGKGTNEDGGGSAVAVGGDGSSAKAADGGTSEVSCHRCGKKGHWRIDCTEELCSRCHGRGQAAGVCPTSEEEAVLTASDDDSGDDTVQASASRPEREASAVRFGAERGNGSRLGK